jgi:hypothetical protein
MIILTSAAWLEILVMRTKFVENLKVGAHCSATAVLLRFCLNLTTVLFAD